MVTIKTKQVLLMLEMNQSKESTWHNRFRTDWSVLSGAIRLAEYHIAAEPFRQERNFQ